MSAKLYTYVLLFIYIHTHTYTDTHTHTLLPISCLLNRARRKLAFYRLAQNYVYMCSVASVVSDSLGPHGLYPARIHSPWNSPGKNIGVSCHTRLQGILTQGSKPHLLGLLQCGQILSSWTKAKQPKYNYKVHLYARNIGILSYKLYVYSMAISPSLLNFFFFWRTLKFEPSVLYSFSVAKWRHKIWWEFGKPNIMLTY